VRSKFLWSDTQLLQLAQSRPDDLSITEYHIQRLFHHLRGAVEIDVYDVIDRLQLDIVTHVFFGESTDSLDSDKQPFRDAMETLLRVNTVRVVLGYARNCEYFLSLLIDCFVGVLRSCSQIGW
jgi:hypothetical protein